MAGVVPGLDDVLLALVAEHADRRGAERQARASPRVQADPARAEDAQEVPVGDDAHILFRPADAVDHPVRALADRLDGLAAVDAVAPDLPAGPLLAHLGRAVALDGTVVP